MVHLRIGFWETEANAVKSKLITRINDSLWIGGLPLKLYALCYPSIHLLITVCQNLLFLGWSKQKGAVMHSVQFDLFHGTKAKPFCEMIQIVWNSLKFMFIVCRQKKLCVGRFQEEICATRQGGKICSPGVNTKQDYFVPSFLFHYSYFRLRSCFTNIPLRVNCASERTKL